MFNICNDVPCAFAGMMSVGFTRTENGGYQYSGYPVHSENVVKMTKETMEQSEMENLRFLRVSRGCIEAKGVYITVPSTEIGGRPRLSWCNYIIGLNA